MKFLRSLLLLAGLGIALHAAEDRLAGYWVPAPGQESPAVLSIGRLGKWTLVTLRWAGADGPETKVRYLDAAEADAGLLTADQKLDKLPDAPATMGYQFKDGQLVVAIAAPSTRAGTYVFAKGSPPTSASVAAARPAASTPSAAPTRPAPATPVPAVNRLELLLGAWETEPNAPVQVSIFFNRSNTAHFKVNQQWIKGSDAPTVSKGGNYNATLLGGHGVLTKDKPDYEGSAIPLVINYAYEGEALVLTVDSGVYAGKHRLLRQRRPGS